MKDSLREYWLPLVGILGIAICTTIVVIAIARSTLNRDPCVCVRKQCTTTIVPMTFGKTTVYLPQENCVCTKKLCPAENPYQ
jgi:hypothetical protein